MTDRFREGAAVLLKLLYDYAYQCDLWEDHLTTKYDSKEEEAKAHRNIQTKYMLPLMQKADDEGFNYTDLMSIIPPPFKTTYDQRARILSEMEREFGEEDEIPF